MARHIPSTLAKTYVHGFVHSGEITYLNVMGQEMELLTLPKLPSACLKEPGHLFRPSRGDGAWRIIERKGFYLSLIAAHNSQEFRKNSSRLIKTRASIEKFSLLLEKDTAQFVARVIVDPSSLAR